MNDQPTILNDINNSLEVKSWYYQKNFFDDQFCEILHQNLILNNSLKFKEAELGNQLFKTKNKAIRNGYISWIDDWDDETYQKLKNFYLELMLSLNQYFFLAMKRFESQIAFYEKGGFYKTHLDQLKNTSHRQLTSCLYLNNCESGGELIIYKKGSKNIIDQIIKPEKGSLALFFSAHIYHEVRPVIDPRYSITSWFRDDQIIPLVAKN